MRTDAQERTQYCPLLCVDPYKSGVGRRRGDIFGKSSRGQSPCQSALL
jgi:hypothetical protein